MTYAKVVSQCRYHTSEYTDSNENTALTFVSLLGWVLINSTLCYSVTVTTQKTRACFSLSVVDAASNSSATFTDSRTFLSSAMSALDGQSRKIFAREVRRLKCWKMSTERTQSSHQRHGSCSVSKKKRGQVTTDV